MVECTETWTVTVLSLYHSNWSVQHWCSGIYSFQNIFFSLRNTSLHFIHKFVCCLYYGLPWASSCFYLGVSDLPSWAWRADISTKDWPLCMWLPRPNGKYLYAGICTIHTHTNFELLCCMVLSFNLFSLFHGTCIM